MYTSNRKAGTNNANEAKFDGLALLSYVTIKGSPYIWKITDKRYDGFYGTAFFEIYITISMGAMSQEIGHMDPNASSVIERYIHHNL